MSLKGYYFISTLSFFPFLLAGTWKENPKEWQGNETGGVWIIGSICEVQHPYT